VQAEATYVISTDGTEYGPAPLSTVAAWAQDGRLKPQSILTEVQTGRRFAASEHPFLRGRLPEVVPPPLVAPFPPAMPAQTVSTVNLMAETTPRPNVVLISVMWGLTALHYAVGGSANGDATLVFGSLLVLGLPSTLIGIILALSKSKTDRINGIIKLILMALALVAIALFVVMMPKPNPAP